jgi:preprotein translocase subunit SecF
MPKQLLLKRTLEDKNSMKFMNYRWLYFSLSAVAISITIISLLLNGLRPSIDFVGGSLLEVESQELAQLPTNELSELVQDSFAVSVVQPTQSGSVIFRGEQINNEQKLEVLSTLRQVDPELVELRFDTIGPTFGREVLTKMLWAVAIVSVSILLYVWYQFSDPMYGVSAILAMFHDTFIVVGAFSLFGYFFNVEVDILFVTALLTTLAFSVHDTIVVFDRIRELTRKHRKLPFIDVVNVAITETLGRSVNNSVTVILMLLALTLLGGETIRWFVAALLVGVTLGTYSSPFLSAPLLVTWHEMREQRKAKRKLKA